MVVVTRDSVIVGRTFERAGTEPGDDSSFAGPGEDGETERYGRVAKGRGARQGGRARDLGFLSYEIDIFEGMEGELWTEGGKCGIDAR